MRTVGQLMSRSIHTVPRVTPMRAALKIMRQHDVRHLPVLDDNHRVLGVISDYDVARACRQGDGLAWVSEIVRPERVQASPSDLATTVLAKMLHTHAECVVVIDAVGSVAGLFTDRDGIELARVALRPWLTVSELMSGDVLVTVPPSTPADQAEQVLFDAGVRHLLVMEDEKVIGVVSHRDLAGRELPVGKLMKDPVHAVAPGVTLEAATELMSEQKIGCLPVVDEDWAPLGILTRTDVLRGLARQLLESAVPRADFGRED